MYDKFNAPKLLQGCMLSGELKWHRNEQDQYSGGKNVKSDDRSSDLISDYKKSAPLPMHSKFHICAL